MPRRSSQSMVESILHGEIVTNALGLEPFPMVFRRKVGIIKLVLHPWLITEVSGE